MQNSKFFQNKAEPHFDKKDLVWDTQWESPGFKG